MRSWAFSSGVVGGGVEGSSPPSRTSFKKACASSIDPNSCPSSHPVISDVVFSIARWSGGSGRSALDRSCSEPLFLPFLLRFFLESLLLTATNPPRPPETPPSFVVSRMAFVCSIHCKGGDPGGHAGRLRKPRTSAGSREALPSPPRGPHSRASRC